MSEWPVREVMGIFNFDFGNRVEKTCGDHAPAAMTTLVHGIVVSLWVEELNTVIPESAPVGEREIRRARAGWWS